MLSLADSSEDIHLQSAFIFAKKKAWGDAIAQAQAAHSAVLVKYFIWEYLKDPEADARFKDISGFIQQNPGWPDQELLVRRAEAALLSESPDDELLDKWYAAHPPKTAGRNKRWVDDKNALHERIRGSWVQDDYTKLAEAKILANYASVLRPEDHAKRIDRLLWENKVDEAKRLLAYAPMRRRLFEARISLMRDSSRAPRDVSSVPPQLRNDAGLVFERMRYRGRHGDKDGVREMLLATPAKLPYPEKWWIFLDRAIRESLGEGKVQLAEKLIARHGQPLDSVQGKEALWLKGWVELEYKKHPKVAYDIFENLYDGMETPGGKSRTAYWAGRAAETAGLKFQGWYEEAAKYNTTFYGQLALLEIYDKPLLKIDADDSDTTREDKKAFASRELVKLVQVLARAKQSNIAGKFILFMVENAHSAKEAVLASQLGRDINRIDIGVRASKKALRDGVVVLSSGYPVIRLNETSGLDKTYILALMRQESEFFSDAMSGSGALGLMQLLPGTAQEIARKNAISFNVNRLFEPDYNMKIGSMYLGGLVGRFDGSYVLATASYNAGPGRVRQWISSFGPPGNSARAVINWIEDIPFSETRNYVQHVMGNMQVYRYVLSGNKPIRLTLGDDLERGMGGAH